MKQFHKMLYSFLIDHVWFSLLVFIATTIPTTEIISQEYKYEYELYTSENGLPSNDIYDLAFDQKGMMWISTQSGVAIFDGNEFTILDHVSTDNRFGNIEIGPNGSLWLLSSNFSISLPTTEKLKHYDPETKVLKSVIDVIPGAEKLLNDYDNYQFWSDEKSNIYLQSVESKQIFQYKGDSLRCIGEQLQIEPQSQRSSENTLLYYDHPDYKKIDLDSERIISFDTRNQDKLVIVQDSVVMYGKYKQTENTTSHKKILTVTDTKNDTIFNEFSYTFNYLHDQNRLFLAFDYTLIEYDLKTNQIIDIDQDIRREFRNNRIKNIWYNNKALWVVAYEGLYKIIKTKPLFKNALMAQLGDTRNIKQYDDENILIGNGNGLTKLNLRNGQETPLLESFLCYGITPVDSFRYLISSFTPKTPIWQWDTRTPNSIKGIRVSDISNKPSVIKNTVFLFSYEDKNGQIWLSSKEGLYKYDMDDSTVERLNSNEANHFYSALIENKRDTNTFFATKQNGLEKVNINSGEITSYKIFKNKSIADIYQDKTDENIFWVSTNSGGLIKWQYEQNIIKTYTLEDGLKSMDVHSAKQDKQGNIWMSTNHGISVLDIKTDKISTFTTINGLHNNEFNRHSHLSIGDSILIYGGVDGITYFKPEETIFQNDLGPTNIIGVKYLNKQSGEEIIKHLEISSNPQIYLNSNFLNPTLLFSKPTTTITQTLRYIIARNEEAWRYTQNNEIPLDNLKQGENNIIISRQIGINKWSKPRSILIHNPIPWYKNIWLYMIAIALVLAYILRSQINRNNRIEKTNKSIRERVKLQTLELSERNKDLLEANEINDQIFSIIGHDLRSPILSLLNISNSLNYLTKKQDFVNATKLASSVEVNANNLLNTVDRLLQWSKSFKTKEMIPRELKIVDLFAEVLDDLRIPIKEKGISITIESSTNEPVLIYENIVSLVIRNLVQNAIKYSHPNGKIELRYTHGSPQKKSSISVSDHGVGIKRDIVEKLLSSQEIQSTNGTRGEKGLGLGLRLCITLLDSIDGRLVASQNDPQGSIFKVYL